MCLVPDIDWQDPVRVQVQNRNMDIRDFMMFGGIFNPLVPFVGYCRFKFPDNVKYPCIPVNVDGIPVYPKSSEGLNGVYVAGSYIYLALRLGAEVFCENGYFLNTLLTDDYKESRSLSYAVIQLVQDRNKAKADHGKKSLEDLILKEMVNSGYGKNSQNVIQKQSWTAFKDLIYIDVPQDKYDVYAPAMAIIITNFLQAFMRRDDVSSGKEITPILFLLDEAVQLNLDYNVLSKAMSTLRSKKVSLFLLMQSIAQLEGKYGEAHAREIIDLCAYISVFNAQDPRSRDFFQKLVGRKKC